MTMLHHLGFDPHFEALFHPHGAAVARRWRGGATPESSEPPR
jgi:hypothetical protein